MSDQSKQYVMHKLMNYAELEAFTAHKKAGSSSAYFSILDEFTGSAPTIVSELKPPANALELPSFLGKIGILQKQMLAVGSSTLLWLAEKVVEAAKLGNKVKCEDELFTLSARVQALCAKLDEARIEGAADAKNSSQPTQPAQPAQPAQPKGPRPQAPVKPQLFEKLHLLIENFERDNAMNMLRSMLSFSFSPGIDPVLVNIYKDLSHFDYDNAGEQAKKLVAMTQAAGAAGAPSKKKKILAIDDVPDVLNTVKAVLKSDYAVYGVTNHMDALKFLTNNVVDLILLDIEMPDMNGFALLSIVRKIKAYENTPVIFLTGNVNIDNVQRAFQEGGNDFIKKPVEAQVLLTKVGKHLV